MTMMKMLGRRVIPSTYFSLRCCFFSTSATLLSRADYVGKGLSKDDCVAPAAVSDGVLVDEVVSELQAGFLQPRVVVYDGGCRFCHNAALRVASYLPLPYSALKVLLIIPAPVRDAVYDYVAKHRYDWFGKQEDCEALQDPEVHQRFVDRKEIWDRCREKYHEDQSTRHSLSAV